MPLVVAVIEREKKRENDEKRIWRIWRKPRISVWKVQVSHMCVSVSVRVHMHTHTHTDTHAHNMENMEKTLDAMQRKEKMMKSEYGKTCGHVCLPITGNAAKRWSKAAKSWGNAAKSWGNAAKT